MNKKTPNPAAVELGRKGGKAPHIGPRGFAAMTPERRKEVAQRALAVRWKETKKK
jgi:hypothetical protein